MSLKQNIFVTISLLAMSSAFGSELVYQPMNPSFGGNISNGNYLLGIANAQKQFEREQDEESALERFNDRLQSSILSRITSAVTRDIVDINGDITPGLFETVDYTIEIVDNGNGILTITTIDKATGEQSVIEVENN